jgi:hypothetical protein
VSLRNAQHQGAIHVGPLRRWQKYGSFLHTRSPIVVFFGGKQTPTTKNTMELHHCYTSFMPVFGGVQKKPGV